MLPRVPDWLRPGSRRVRALARDAEHALERAAAFRDVADVELARHASAARAGSGGGPQTKTALGIEALRRGLGLELHLEQVMAAMAMTERVVVEVKTGEGKTASGALAAAVHALSGRRVHVVTTSDYLAERDARAVAPALAHLGVHTSFVRGDLERRARRAAYRAGVVYAAHKELGFDYLRDQLQLRSFERVGRERDVALVDEADAVLIDEATVPVKIARAGRAAAEPYVEVARSLERLMRERDYVVEPATRQAYLTEAGTERLEALLRAEGLLDDGALHDDPDLVRLAATALHATAVLERDCDYLVEGSKVVLLDPHTGRPHAQRRWSDGLHQAVEAKERLPRSAESETAALCHYAGLFRLYALLAGMTGTTGGAEEELRDLYQLEVVRIPEHRPCVRADEPDRVFADDAARSEAVLADIRAAHARCQPVLVVADTEAAAAALTARARAVGLHPKLLSAKDPAAEAEVVADAGRLASVTIATSIAGRGTDVVLGGPRIAEKESVERVGGLRVLGVGRRASRRLDDQIRGRAGRQGEPGASAFYVSLDDELVRAFAPEAVEAKVAAARAAGGEVREPWAARLVEECQTRSTRRAFAVRLERARFDGALDEQREVAYALRESVLLGSADPRFASTVEVAAWEAPIGAALDRLIERHTERTEGAPRVRARLLARSVADVYGVQLDEERAASAADDPARLRAHVLDCLRAQRGRMVTTVLAGVEAAGPADLDARRARARAALDAAMARAPIATLRFFRLSYLAHFDAALTAHLEDALALRQGAALLAVAERRPDLAFRVELKARFDRLLEHVAREVRRDLLPRRPLRLADVRAWEAALQREGDLGAPRATPPWRVAPGAARAAVG